MDYGPIIDIFYRDGCIVDELEKEL